MTITAAPGAPAGRAEPDRKGPQGRFTHGKGST